MSKLHYNTDNIFHYRQTKATVEITILSGEDLRINNRSIKSNSFVIVRSGGESYRRTDVARDGGSYPRWNERLFLQTTPAAITIEVHCRTAFGDRVVGTASVPKSDYSGGYVPESYLNFLSYRLRDSKGVRNGIINVSVRVSCEAIKEVQGVIMGVPVGESCSEGVIVTGVPVLSKNDGKREFV